MLVQVTEYNFWNLCKETENQVWLELVPADVSRQDVVAL